LIQVKDVLQIWCWVLDRVGEYLGASNDCLLGAAISGSRKRNRKRATW